MKYLLDTNLCIALIRRTSEGAERRLVAQAVTDVAISALTVAELEYGVARSRQPRLDADRLERFLQPLQIVGFDDGAAAAYGPARAALEKEGVMIGPIDMLLAAQALSLGVTLVTNNTQEFRRVKGLKVQDWTR